MGATKFTNGVWCGGYNQQINHRAVNTLLRKIVTQSPCGDKDQKYKIWNDSCRRSFCRAPSGYPVTSHHSWMFLISRRACSVSYYQLGKQINKWWWWDLLCYFSWTWSVYSIQTLVTIRFSYVCRIKENTLPYQINTQGYCEIPGPKNKTPRHCDSVSFPPKHQEVFSIFSPKRTLRLHHHVNKPTWRFSFFTTTQTESHITPSLPDIDTFVYKHPKVPFRPRLTTHCSPMVRLWIFGFLDFFDGIGEDLGHVQHVQDR